MDMPAPPCPVDYHLEGAELLTCKLSDLEYSFILGDTVFWPSLEGTPFLSVNYIEKRTFFYFWRGCHSVFWV